MRFVSSRPQGNIERRLPIKCHDDTLEKKQDRLKQRPKGLSPRSEIVTNNEGFCSNAGITIR